MRAPHRALTAAFVFVTVCGVTARVAAEPVRLNFEITGGATFGNLQDIFGIPIVTGDRVLGVLVYDPAVPDRNPDPIAGDYRPAGSMRLLTGSGVTVPLEAIGVFDEVFSPFPGVDDAFTAGGFTQSFPGFESIQLQLDFRGTGRTGDALPGTAEEVLATFSTGSFRLVAFKTGVNPPFDRGTHELFGPVRLLADSGQPIPEPGTVLLFATGAATLFRRHRKFGAS